MRTSSNQRERGKYGVKSFDLACLEGPIILHIFTNIRQSTASFESRSDTSPKQQIHPGHHHGLQASAFDYASSNSRNFPSRFRPRAHRDPIMTDSDCDSIPTSLGRLSSKWDATAVA